MRAGRARQVWEGPQTFDRGFCFLYADVSALLVCSASEHEASCKFFHLWVSLPTSFKILTAVLPPLIFPVTPSLQRCYHLIITVQGLAFVPNVLGVLQEASSIRSCSADLDCRQDSVTLFSVYEWLDLLSGSVLWLHPSLLSINKPAPARQARRLLWRPYIIPALGGLFVRPCDFFFLPPFPFINLDVSHSASHSSCLMPSAFPSVPCSTFLGCVCGPRPGSVVASSASSWKLFSCHSFTQR